jgi:hypothetical protein
MVLTSVLADTICSSAVRGELVNIRIEDDPATVYRVHKDLLVEHSEYFKSALNGPWSEAEDGIAPLEGVDHRTCKTNFESSETMN